MNLINAARGKVYVLIRLRVRLRNSSVGQPDRPARNQPSTRRRAVDNQMRSYMRTESSSRPWPAGDRILVCLSSHPLGERLVRAGRRLSDDLNGDMDCRVVETPGHIRHARRKNSGTHSTQLESD